MKYTELLSALKKKEYKPIYFLYGSEPFYIDKITEYFENKVLSQGEKAFNYTVLYGKEATHLAVVDTARRYPMMSPYQLIIVKEAQEMKSLTKLLSYVEHPMQTTILVLCYKHKKFDGRTKFAKALKKKAVFFEAKKLYDNQVVDWLSNYLKEKGYKIENQAAALIAEYLGTNLSKVSNELDKLILNVPKDTLITSDHVQKNIGISKEYNVFELQKAIGQRNHLKTQRIINYFISNPKKNPLVVIIGTLYGYFSKLFILHSSRGKNDNELAKAMGLRSSYFLNDYKIAGRNYPRLRVEQVIGLLKEYDLKSKGINRNSTPDSELLREMILKILG